MKALKEFNQEFALNKARYNLTKYYTNKAESLCRVLGIGFADSGNASEDFTEVKEQWDKAFIKGGVIDVFSGASFNTVFTTKHSYHAFRFWHDFLHVKNNLSFEHECEILIGFMHVSEIENEFGVDSLESKLIRADTVGQTDYHRKYGKFPDNQLEFCKAYIQLLN